MTDRCRIALSVLVVALIGTLVSGAQPPASISIPREVTVRPLYYHYSTPPSGGIGVTRIENQKRAYSESDADENVLRLAISENLPRGAGNMLRVAAWTAAVTAGRVEGTPLSGQSFLIDVKGMVDGPSVGALYAVGMLATLRGDSLLPNVTMTGTILPGGALGVVGGVAQKLDAALKGGMRKVVLSDSQRIDFDPDGGIVDVADYAARIGIEVAFAGNLQEAYYEMTGKTLARSGAPIRGGVSLPDNMMKAIRGRTQQRFAGVSKVIGKLNETPKADPLVNLPEIERDTILWFLGDTFGLLEVSRMRALALMQEGEWVAAYDVLASAMLEAHTIISWREAGFKLLDDEQITDMITQGLTISMEQRDKAAHVAGRLPVEVALLRARVSRDHLDLSVPLFLRDTRDYLLHTHSEDVRNRQMESPDAPDVSNEVDELRVYEIRARTEKTLLAYRYQASRSITGRANPLSVVLDPDLLAGSLVFRETARAPRPLDLRKTIDWAAFAGSSYKAVHDALTDVMSTDNEDVIWGRLLDPAARRAMALTEILSGESEDAETPAGDAAPELTALDWFTRALIYTQEEIEIGAYLVRLELGQFEAGARNPLLRSGSLRRLLDQAREDARKSILTAQRAGYQVIGPRYDYLLAQGLRYGDIEDQFKALRLYWSAAVLCQLVDLCTQP